MPTPLIAERPPNDGREWDCRCARCGASTEFIRCEQCDDGYVSRYEEDPLWYDEDDLWPCDWCRGAGGWQHCGNSADWCDAHPLPGRGSTERGAIEWFVIEQRAGGAK